MSVGNVWGVLPGENPEEGHRRRLSEAISSESVHAALKGFPLGFADGVTPEWFLRFLIDRLVVAEMAESLWSDAALPPYRQRSRALEKLAKQATDLATGLDRQFGLKFLGFRSYKKTADDLWDEDDWSDMLSDRERLSNAVYELRWLSTILKGTAGYFSFKHSENHKPRWRQKHTRLIRVARGICLAYVFESGFGKKIDINDWGSDGSNAQGPTHFMDFYQRIVRLAFGEEVTPDIAGVLKQAREAFRHDVFHPCDDP